MTRLVLHIGMPKTGTSSIQSALGLSGGHHWLMLLAATGPALKDYMKKFQIRPVNQCCAPGNEANRRKIVTALEDLKIQDHRFEISEPLKLQVREKYRQANERVAEKWLNGVPLARKT